MMFAGKLRELCEIRSVLRELCGKENHCSAGLAPFQPHSAFRSDYRWVKYSGEDDRNATPKTTMFVRYEGRRGLSANSHAAGATESSFNLVYVWCREHQVEDSLLDQDRR